MHRQRETDGQSTSSLTSMHACMDTYLLTEDPLVPGGTAGRKRLRGSACKGRRPAARRCRTSGRSRSPPDRSGRAPAPPGRRAVDDDAKRKVNAGLNGRGEGCREAAQSRKIGRVEYAARASMALPWIPESPRRRPAACGTGLWLLGTEPWT